MAEVTQDLMYELLKTHACGHFRSESTVSSRSGLRYSAMRGTMISMQQDIHNIYGMLTRHEQRLDRIENRLELRELAEAQARFEPHP